MRTPMSPSQFTPLHATAEFVFCFVVFEGYTLTTLETSSPPLLRTEYSLSSQATGGLRIQKKPEDGCTYAGLQRVVSERYLILVAVTCEREREFI